MLQGSERQVPTWLFYGGWDGEGLEAGVQSARAGICK